MQMVMLVFYQVDRLSDVLDLWRAQGAQGITVLEGRTPTHDRGDSARGEAATLERCVTLFAVLSDRAASTRCIEATERVVGVLAGETTGFMASWDLAVLKGMGNPALNAWPM